MWRKKKISLTYKCQPRIPVKNEHDKDSEPSTKVRKTMYKNKRTKKKILF